ncbi:MAG: aldehyde dehydrogenase family protein, partial [Bdellovibrionaceae bacterium]|nr:aldehyde dehydrogenase family protein [Pseudobdellovibrionaceae bacterium]
MDTLKITSWMGQAPASINSSIPFHSPFDGRLLAEVFPSDAMDVVKALGAAKKSMESWASTSHEEKALVLEGMANTLEAHLDSFAREIAEFEGWSLSFAKAHLVEPVASLFKKTIAELRSAGAGETLQPTGLLTLVLPGVASFRVLGERLIPALAAGNVVLVKISMRSPGTLPLWQKILESSSLPEGVVSLLIGKGAEIGDLMVRHPSV